MKYLFLFLPFLCFSNMPSGCFTPYSNHYFVETGTLGGRGIFNAMQNNSFVEYHTIEIDKGNYTFSRSELRKHPQVHCYWGSSVQVLPKIIKHMDKPITFWLDAHVYPPIPGQQNTPLIDEIEIIKSHPIKTHTIIIDDLHCCNTLSFDFLSVQDLMDKILEINPDYQFKLIAGGDQAECPDNILVAYIEK